MGVIRQSILIRAEPERVFRAYAEEIDRWWPRQGTYRYSFAPPDRTPSQIRFEGGLGGRFYETFDDGSEYVIGEILVWEPPSRLCYSWRDPRWSISTEVEVRFEAIDGKTRVTVLHDGFDQIREGSTGYAVGLSEILAAFESWVEKREVGVLEVKEGGDGGSGGRGEDGCD